MPTDERPEVIEFGDFCLDARDGRLERDGREVPLTPTLLAILLTAIEHAGRIVTKQQFMERVWPGRFVEDGNLARNISTLRNLLDDDPQNPRYIETIPRRGYRFVAEVEVRSGEDAGPGLGAGEPGPVDERPAPRRPPTLVRVLPGRFAAAALSVLIVVAAGLIAASHLDGRAPTQPIRSLVVLPFENLSGDPGQAYFADGMTEELISNLGKLGELSVTSRTSSMHYKGTRKRLPEIGRELGVDAIVEGGVLRVDDRLRFTVRLVEAATDRAVWGETYEVAAGDVLALHNEITRSIARSIDVPVAPDEARRLATVAPIDDAAHEAYLRGKFLKNQFTVASLHGAISYFHQSLDIAPEFPLAHAALADTYLILASWQGPSRALWSKARQHAETAISIDAQVAEAHTVLAGALLCNDLSPAAADRVFRRALELNPSSTMTLSRYAYSLMAQGRFSESLRWARRGLELDPVSVINSSWLGQILHYAGRHEEAIVQLESALELDAHFAVTHRILGQVYLAIGERERAVGALERAYALGGGPGVIGELGYAYARAGRSADARAQLDVLDELASQGRDSAFNRALVYHGLGDRERAFEWLEAAYEERDFRMMCLLVDPIWDELRSDPRFDALLTRIGLKPAVSA